MRGGMSSTTIGWLVPFWCLARPLTLHAPVVPETCPLGEGVDTCYSRSRTNRATAAAMPMVMGSLHRGARSATATRKMAMMMSASQRASMYMARSPHVAPAAWRRTGSSVRFAVNLTVGSRLTVRVDVT